ncbi:MAG: hypothetical protein ACAI44_08945 [Candidatus Sericytochromatia bacterium]
MHGNLILFGPISDDYSHELLCADLSTPITSAPTQADKGAKQPIWQAGYALSPLLSQSAAAAPELLYSLRTARISPRQRLLAGIQPNLNPVQEERFLEAGLNLDLLLLLDPVSGNCQRYQFPDFNYARLQDLDFSPGEDALVSVLIGQPRQGRDFRPEEEHSLLLFDLETRSHRLLPVKGEELYEPHFTRWQDRQVLLCRSCPPYAPRSAESWRFFDPASGESWDFELFDLHDPLVSTLRMSPDGSAVAYICQRGSQICLMRYLLASGKHQVLTEIPLLEISLLPNELLWSPDSQAVAFQLYQPPAEPARIVDLRLPLLSEHSSEEESEHLRRLLTDTAFQEQHHTVIGYTRKPELDLRGVWVFEAASSISRRVVCCDEHFILSWSQPEPSSPQND